MFQIGTSNLRPLLSIIFLQGFLISKNIGHPTSGSGGKKTFKQYLKGEHTDGQTDRWTRRRTFRLIESIGPEGQCFEKFCATCAKEILEEKKKEYGAMSHFYPL